MNLGGGRDSSQIYPGVHLASFTMRTESHKIWTGEGNLSSTGNRYPDRPVCNESLYRLRYPKPTYTTKRKGKGKVYLRTGHHGPEGEQRYSSALSLTSALDEVSGQRHTPAASPPSPPDRPGNHCIRG